MYARGQGQHTHRKAEEQAGLADTRVSNQEQLEQVIAARNAARKSTRASKEGHGRARKGTDGQHGPEPAKLGMRMNVLLGIHDGGGWAGWTRTVRRGDVTCTRTFRPGSTTAGKKSAHCVDSLYFFSRADDERGKDGARGRKRWLLLPRW